MSRPPVQTDEALQGSILRRLTLLERRRVGGWRGQGDLKLGTLEATYRGWGPAKVKVDGVLSTDAYSWTVPYIPNGPRLVRLVWTGDTWVIAGQVPDETVMLDYDPAVVTIHGERMVDTVWNLRPRATLLALSGLVVLSGMMQTVGTPTAGTVLGNLPVGMRPPVSLLFPIEYGDSARSLGIHPDGDITLSGAPGANLYVSLDGIAFHPDGVGTWTDVGSGGSSFGANFGNWTDPDYGVCQFYKDPWGFTWYRGLVRVNVATSTNDTTIITVPSTHRAVLAQHIRATGENVYAGLYGQTTNGVGWMLGSPGSVGQWISLSGLAVVTSDAVSLNVWKNIGAFANSWAHHTPGTFPTPAYLRREDGLAMTKGLLTGGTINTKQAMMTQEEMWPSGGRIIVATSSNLARGRLDVMAARDFDGGGPGTLLGRSASNTWFSWDSLKWVP